MSELKSIINERRSANNFIKGVKIPKEDFIEIFDLLKLAPSCFNIQHAHYLVITDETKKEALREAAFNQYKIHTASAAIIVLGDRNAYKNADKIYSGMLNLKMMSQFDYDQMLNSINNLYEGRGESFKRDEAIRNGALSAMMFMLMFRGNIEARGEIATLKNSIMNYYDTWVEWDKDRALDVAKGLLYDYNI